MVRVARTATPGDPAATDGRVTPPGTGEGVRGEGLTKRYGDLLAVDDVSVSLGKGHTLVLLGPSGSGKTTLLRLIAGLERPTSGRVYFGDTDVTDLPLRRRGVGMVFQNYALFPHMTVRENVAYGLRARGRRGAEVTRAVDRMLELVDLADKADSWPAQLSGGQQQRVAVARALIIDPAVLLLDEPFSALDLKLRQRMQYELRDLLGRIRPSAIHVTHDQEEAMVVGDEIAVMNQGRIEQVGTPDELYDRPATRFVASFLGDANLLPATGDGSGDRYVRVGDRTLPVPEPVGSGDLFCVRPERVQLRPLRTDSPPEALTGTVEAVTFLGKEIEYRVSVPPAERLRVRAPSSVERHEVGARVEVVLPASIPLVRG
ncbi:MAG: ABC transporter ATP-binding protein [Micromonosporaceae bacterium]